MKKILIAIMLLSLTACVGVSLDFSLGDEGLEITPSFVVETPEWMQIDGGANVTVDPEVL